MAFSDSAKGDAAARYGKTAGGLAATGLLTGVACHLPGSAATAPLFVALMLASFAAFWLTARLFMGADGDPARETRFIFCSALALRLLVLPSDPAFDDDLYRYRWDGKVLAAGINPYRDSPDAEALRFLRDAEHDRIAYAYVPTIYPPLSQALFWGVYRLYPSGLMGFKLLAVLFDLLTLVLLFRLLKALDLPPARACLYAWHPLVIKEFANSGHQDSVGLCLLLAFLVCAVRRRPASAAVALACSALTKLVPLSLLALARGRLVFRHGLLAVALMAAAYAPFFVADADPLAGLRVYAEYWEFNGGLFALIRRLAAEWTTAPAAWAKGVAVAGYGAALIVAAWRVQRDGPDRGRAWVTAVGAVLTVGVLLAPTVDPWYVCWLTPFLCVASCPGVFLLTGAVLLSYAYYAGGAERTWVLVLEYAPVYLLLLRQGYCAWWRR